MMVTVLVVHLFIYHLLIGTYVCICAYVDMHGEG